MTMRHGRVGCFAAALCAGVLLFPAAGTAQTQIKPYIMILLDTSSSMLINPNNPGWESLGDGSNNAPYRTGWSNCCPGIDTAGWDTDSLPNDSRLYIAKDALRDIVSGYGDVQFGLMRYRQYECAIGWGQDMNYIVFPAYQGNMRSGLGATVNQTGWGQPYQSGTRELDLITYVGFNCRVGAACGLNTTGTCNTSGSGGDVLVPIGEDSQNEILRWLDNSETFSSNPAPPTSGTLRCAATTITNPELRASGLTPLARSIDAARTYFAGVIAADPPLLRTCRGYYLVIITDGDDTCGGDPVAAVTSLTSSGVDSYTIGFAFSSTTLNGMAAAGGTGRTTAFSASNKSDLAAAFAQIINDTALTEVCNGRDDDCDGLTDEGFALYCNRPSHPAQDLCTDPGETLCNGVDDNCNGRTDEGLLNLCGACGPAPTEICDLIDNDCDTLTDEGGVCTPGCTPTAEICNNRDDDCDTMIDDGVTRPCGSSIGECRPGTQTCTAGVWGPCAGSVGPATETCDNRDNDCDGRTDGFTRPCGSSTGVCRPGTQLCTAGSWSADYVGTYTGGPEVCNLLDDDCDGSTDEGDPGGGGECGGSVGECLPGTRHCVGGALVCVGGRDPVPETCNNRDDDCDGSTDEGNPGGGASCYSGRPGTDGVGICEGGVVRCLAGALVCDGEVRPGTEDCNNLDDDCDTETDEGLASGATCGTDEGECSAGTSRCVAGAWVCEGEVGPGTETCDLRDNDCDGATDEGNPGGGLPCGWNPDDPSVWDLGICEPGISNCVGGAIRCEGMIGPAEELCNALDDDCNGRTDDLPDTGTPCGSDVGECAAGTLRCLDGAMQCVGGRGPTPEFCDCLDNDCDGATDNGAECGGGAACIACTCVVPCDPGIELNCPTGRVCECGVNPENPAACYCMPDLERCGDDVCNLCEDCIGGACVETVTCGECQRCNPATGTCVDLCAGVTCDPGLECECGRCEVPDCYSAGHECPAGYQCEDGTCVADACYAVSCPAPQFCRDGACHDPCEVEDVCEAGQVCYDGVCIPDPCYGVTCDPGEECAGGTCSAACAEVECSWPLECDPATGECEEPPCWDVRCPEGYDCVNGTCYERGHPADDADGGGEAGTGRQVLATGAGGCACRTPPARGGGAGGLLALLALAGLGARRSARKGKEG